MKLFKAMLCSVAALSLLLPAAHAQAAPTVVKIALTQPTGHPTTDLIRGQFKKTIEEKTNGRFRIDVFDNYSFGKFEAVVQGLQFGRLQFAHESPSNLSIYDPKLMIFGPFSYTHLTSPFWRKTFTQASPILWKSRKHH